MEKTTFNKPYLYNLYGGSEEDILFVLNEFLAGYDEMLQSLIKYFSDSTFVKFREELHKHSCGFTYVGFDEITNTINSFSLRCKSATAVAEVREEFEQIIRVIKECKEICIVEAGRMDKGYAQCA